MKRIILGLALVLAASFSGVKAEEVRITNTCQLCIQSNVEMMGNSRVIVESGGVLIVNGGTLSNVDLVLKAGSSLRLINGGVIVTQNGFKAPVGATIDINYGQIL